ncbi:hypothetical protein Lfu02_45940 [Longispora fulva]|uniref:DUF2203 family protein n=1 Tax=Longispora fulva TaxID=619741 RepID=A0A8J7GSQ8_9ACTN|nr:DUF2203 domain-containing protein [Longispora fulva]MBG6137969.1 hypothetical protein [Longispora fulva]GIG60222.1 hypothetical protein Lfu02_45940 [Longispora fulva]
MTNPPTGDPTDPSGGPSDDGPLDPSGGVPEPGPVTLGEARRILAGLLPHIHNLIALRADFAELQADLAADGTSPLGGLAEAKSLEARLFATVEHLAAHGAQVKGFAPVLLDFLGERDGRPVLWCWLEGDPDIYWYHRQDAGFAARRPV